MDAAGGAPSPQRGAGSDVGEGQLCDAGRGGIAQANAGIDVRDDLE